MRQFFYAVARHSTMLRVLVIVAVIAAMAVAVGTPEIAVAGPDCNGP